MESMEMGEQQIQLKHVCKFCGKSFACGRSLGGHMRSHMVNDISSSAGGTKLTKKKLPPLPTYLLSNSNSNHHKNKNDIITTTTTNSNNIVSPGSPGYVLRENPKRSLKFSDHNSRMENNTNNNNINNNDNNNNHHHSVFLDNSCKECGKVFESWKALFGHMKFHSMEKERLNNCFEEEEEEEEEEQEDSWTIANNNNNSNQKLVMDSQADNETAAPRRRRRSKRRTKYAGNSSPMSVPINASSSVSETEQEQEEVALCLIMLSRDVGQCGGLTSLAESSDNNSLFLGTNPIGPKDGNVKNSPCSGREALKGIQKSQEDNQGEFDNSQVEIGKFLLRENGIDKVNEDARKYIFLNKRKSIDCFDPEMKDSLKKFKASESEESSKFGCTTCNKVFHSYQALGGHRASHKKIKGCFASKIDSGENSIETESPPDQTSDSNKLISDKCIKPIGNRIPTDELAINWDERAETSNGTKKSKIHECQVCLKVFPSGQALGGHKRAHMAGDADAKNNQTVSTPEPIPAIRDFLDLNLPAPVEEESNGIVGFNPWWIGSSHNHEPLIGLISN